MVVCVVDNGVFVNVLVEVDSTVRKLAEGSSLLDLSCLLGVLEIPIFRSVCVARQTARRLPEHNYERETHVFDVSHGCVWCSSSVSAAMCRLRSVRSSRGERFDFCWWLIVGWGRYLVAIVRDQSSLVRIHYLPRGLSSDCSVHCGHVRWRHSTMTHRPMQGALGHLGSLNGRISPWQESPLHYRYPSYPRYEVPVQSVRPLMRR